ncbi:MAG: glucose-6-phosphate isomerase [Verrucomicrobia bacterium]|nr:MAG: glucose-6-phosphate isomerase [Verrucomicrobiota bacterium]
MSWERFKKYYIGLEKLGFAMDVSKVDFDDAFLASMDAPMKEAFAAMKALEGGATANPDEGRMVGHYWLRAPELAPTPEIRSEIEATVAKIKDFAEKVHSGKISGADGKFENILCIGIGGSALGPQFVSEALGSPRSDKMKAFFLDNTDPDGYDIVFDKLEGKLGRTLAVIASKSGGTPEPRNAMVEAIVKWEAAGLDFAKHAVVTTGENSKLYNFAKQRGFLEFFPMWDWVGGRTSEFAAVGLLPAALQGIDIGQMLGGAADMDAATRVEDASKNPAAMLALMWWKCTGGKGLKDMVILPYKDRLLLFSRYLQQLIMESLGKEFNLKGERVEQGISVFGNKGSTDQHAYVQQLRDGIDNFFVTFIEVLKDRCGASPEVSAGETSGDYLQAFMLGTRKALAEKGRESITITVADCSPRSIGMLIALYDRAVGFYASLAGINAYHQPGVEAGKKAASSMLAIKAEIVAALESAKRAMSVDEIAKEIKLENDKETVFKLLMHLISNVQSSVSRQSGSGFEAKFIKGN